MSQAPVAITSPVAVGPPSMMPAAPSASSPARNSNTIILVIVIIAIVVFLVFLFTKLNTMNKELKELKAEREQTAKLLKAMADRMGVQQDEKGEIHFVEKDDDECEDGETNENDDDEKSGAVCIDDGGQCDMKGPDIMLRPPGCLFNMFGSRVGGGVRGGGVPVDMTAVFQQMMPTIDEEPTSVPAAASETKVSPPAPAAGAPQVPVAKVAESVSVD